MLCSLCTRNFDLRAANPRPAYGWDDSVTDFDCLDYDLHEMAEGLTNAAAEGRYICSNEALHLQIDPEELLELFT